MTNQDNVVSFENSARERASTLSAKLVREIRAILLDTMPKLVQSLYEKLDDGLFEQALFEKTGKNDSLDNLFFDTMRQLRKKRESFIRIYVRTVTRQYDDFWNLQRTAEDDQSSLLLDLNEDSMSLIDQGDLEEDLAMDGVIAKGMREFSKEVYALNQRFAAMKSVEAIKDEDNPVGPAIISKAFPVSISELEVDLRIKLVIYKLFEREVVQYLGAMYDEINELLKQNGVLPKLPSRVKKNPVSPAIMRQKEIEAEASGEPLEAIAGEDSSMSEAEQAEMFNQLRGLLQNSRGHRPENYAALPKVEVNELISALSGLQQLDQDSDFSLEQAMAEVGNLRNSLSSSLQMGADVAAVKAFNGMDEDTIDVISMIFEFILEDTNLPDAMKALLSRLQIPMLKVAILDRKFFGDKQHPARRLLNLLAKSAVGWVDDGDRSEKSFFGKVSQIVNSVLNDFHEDLSLFEKLYEDFYQFVNKEEQGAEVIEERITEVTKGKEKMKLAQIRVAEVVNTRVKGVKHLPEVVKEILKDGWKDVLTLAYLRQGEESEKWLHVVGLVDKLLWSVQPKIEVPERQKLLKSIPELLKALRAELVEISYDQHKLGQMFKALQTCHIHALKGGQAPEVKPPKEQKAPVQAATQAVEETPSTPPSNPSGIQPQPPESPESQQTPVSPTSIEEEDIIESPVDLRKLEKSADAKMDEFDEIARDLKVGSWIEWAPAEGNVTRGKLSWKSSVTGTLVFVGRKGTKLAELTNDELADLLRLGKAQLLEETEKPLLERAMNAMVDALKKTENAPQA